MSSLWTHISLAEDTLDRTVSGPSTLLMAGRQQTRLSWTFVPNVRMERLTSRAASSIILRMRKKGLCMVSGGSRAKEEEEMETRSMMLTGNLRRRQLGIRNRIGRRPVQWSLPPHQTGINKSKSSGPDLLRSSQSLSSVQLDVSLSFSHKWIATYLRLCPSAHQGEFIRHNLTSVHWTCMLQGASHYSYYYLCLKTRAYI